MLAGLGGRERVNVTASVFLMAGHQSYLTRMLMRLLHDSEAGFEAL